MSILTVEKINHGFGDRAIFEDVSFRLLKGEHVGLIGANGEGKSTFLNLITSKMLPDEGKVIWSSKVKVGYLDQHTVLGKGITIRDAMRKAFDDLVEAEAAMLSMYEKMADVSEEEMNEMLEEIGIIQDTLDHHDYYSIDVKIEEVAQALGLKDIGLERDVEELSGGQRSKVLLGKLLLEKPDILLLDEPTNYLDEDHIAWLANYLKQYENAFILISHDIPFLNDVVNLIYHIEQRRLTRYVGNYDEFLRVYEMNKRQLEAAYERQQMEINKLEDFVARNKARVATRGMAASRQKKLDKMDRIELMAEKPKPEFRFQEARSSSRVVAEAKGLVIGYETPLSRPLDFVVEKGQKIALYGANGLGKSTLLKSMMGLIEPLSGQVHLGDHVELGYFEQEANMKDKTCIDEIWDTFPQYSQYEVRSALAKCGLTTQQLESKLFVLSGGEQAKVRLCKLQNQASNVLILDEPTNHLDVDAKEALKKALREYRGTILLVCHEPEFYRDVCDVIWNCEDWATKIA